MKTRPDTNPAAQNGVDAGRRNALKLAGLGVATLGMMPLLNVSTAKAQDMSNGANNFYTSDKVNLQKVTFRNQYQMNVAGNLFTPKTLNRNAKAPAVIVGHPMGAVKEQSANLYATMMAERGFVALSLDLPFWGESEGQPRNLVSPDIYAEGFSAAVDFLGTQAVCRQKPHRCDRHLRQRKLRHQRGQDRPAHEGDRDGEHVRHGRG